MINIQDITPFMKKGWVAMDENREWHWWQNKPEQRLKNDTFSYWWKLYGYMVCLSNAFDIAHADDWKNSLIKVGGK